MESEPARTVHRIRGRRVLIVVHEGNSLAILVARQSDLLEPVETREHRVQLILGDVLRDVAHVETDVALVRVVAATVVRGRMALIVATPLVGVVIVRVVHSY